MSKYAVVSGELGQEAGRICWWELRGSCLHQDLVEALELEGTGIPAPPKPTLDQALWRAGLAVAIAASTKTHSVVLRSIARNVWEAFAVTTVADEDTDQRAEFTSLAVAHVATDDEGKRVVVKAREGGETFAEKVKAAVPEHLEILTATDISGWLLTVASSPETMAVSLRTRGGFYFIPAGPGLARWLSAVQALTGVSETLVHQMPTLPTQEATRAVLAAARREATEAFEAMDAYLSGSVSTRGLNGIERDLAAACAKIRTYSRTFADDLTDLQERAVMLEGALQAARLERDMKR